MFLAILLVTAMTIIFAALNRVWKWRVCPICAGVSGSWLILTAGIVFGNWSGDYKLPIAMLMGGTVVGIAFQGESKLNWAQSKFLSSGSSALLWFWKAPVVIFGMAVAYWLFKNMSPATFAVEIFILAFLVYYFFIQHQLNTTGAGFIKSSRLDKRADGRHIAELEEKMKKCC